MSIRNISSRFLNSGYVQGILVFIIIFVTFQFFYRESNYPYFIGEDSFYHVAMAKYMMQNGLVIHQFPYLNFTIVNEKFVDWHFFFHVLLIPFIKIFGEILGPKILGTSLLAGTFAIIFVILKKNGLKLAFAYALMLFFLMPQFFYFRMTFIRAPGLSLFLMILSLFWLIKNRPIALAITMFFYVWSYYLVSFFLLIPILAYLIVQIFHHEKLNYKILTWALIGLVAGLIINPFFPENLHFLIVLIRAGAERWYAGVELFPFTTWLWFYSSLMTALLFFGGMIISMVKNIKQDAKNIAILIFAFVILIMQWKSRRFIEYWPPLAGLTGLLLIGPYIENTLFNIKNNWKKAESWIIVVLVLVFIQEGIFHGIWEYWNIKKSLQPTQGIELLKEASIYLSDHSEKGEIVFARWDIFPQLFYFNQKNYYVVGIDTIFLEDYSKPLLEKYIDLTLVKDQKTDLKVIKDDFKAKWVVADAQQQSFKERLQKSPELFKQVFANSGYTVFEVL